MARRSVLLGSGAAAAVAAIGCALAGAAGTEGDAAGKEPQAAKWPDKVIRIIVTNAPGGPTDEVARLLATEVGRLIGATMIVENRPGAASNIGIMAVARAEPDGDTLLFVPNSIAVNPAMSSRIGYDAITDFAPISLSVTSPVVFAVATKLGVRTIAELVALARREPDHLSYSSPGVGTVPHLAAEYLKWKAGITIAHVPHNGAAPAVQSVLSGAVELTVGAMTASQPLIESGMLVGLAVSSAERWHGLPAVPTMVESGYPDFVAESFFALFAPARTPPAIQARLADAVHAVLVRPEVVARLDAAGLAVPAGGPDALRARLAREIPFWRALVASAHLKPPG